MQGWRTNSMKWIVNAALVLVTITSTCPGLQADDDRRSVGTHPTVSWRW
jgi:hypothetical protein